MVRIGARLKHARLLIGINLRTAAELAGITESYLSKLENDRVRPSLATLHRIANALDTNISALTSETEPTQGYATVIKQEQRPAIEFGDDGDNAEGIRLEKLMPSSPANLLQANVHVVSPGGGSKEQISHRGQEFGYVLEGSLQLIVCDETYEISAGDAFSFNSSLRTAITTLATLPLASFGSIHPQPFEFQNAAMVIESLSVATCENRIRQVPQQRHIAGRRGRDVSGQRGGREMVRDMVMGRGGHLSEMRLGRGFNQQKAPQSL